MFLGIALLLLLVIIFLSATSWLPFKKALEGNRYATFWRVVIFLISFLLLSFITVYILANSIYLER